MEFLLTSGATAVLISFVLWLARNLIITRLTKSVEYEYSRLMEYYKQKLRRFEEVFKSDLKIKELEISALRSGVLSAVSSRQSLLDKRRFEATDEVWGAVVSLGALKFVSSWMAHIKFEEASEAAKTDPNVRRMVDVLDKQIDPESPIFKGSAIKARPYVTPMLWATYSAYTAVLMQAVSRARVIKYGVGFDIIDEKRSSEILKIVLPHQSDYIDKFGASCYHYLLEELEEKIIHEIHQTISGAETDDAGIEQAAAVIKKCSELSNKAGS